MNKWLSFYSSGITNTTLKASGAITSLSYQAKVVNTLNRLTCMISPYMYQTITHQIALKWLFLLLISIGLSLSMQAQSVPLPETMTRESVLKRDTTKGIHHLFRARRIGAIVSFGLGAYAIYGGIQSANSFAVDNSLLNGTYFSNPASRSSSFSTNLLSSLPGALFVGVGISKWIRFNKKKEIDLLAAYENGVPLPEEIQRRLKGRHLVSSTLPRPTAIPDTLINQSSVRIDAITSTSGVVTDTLISPVVRPGTVTVAAVLQGDTVRAIHHLFSTRRGGSTANIVLGIITTVGGIALAAALRAASDKATNGLSNLFSPYSAKTQAHATSPSGLSVSWPGILLTGVGIAKSARFSKDAERVLIEAYENGVPLPMSIKRKLEPQHF